jgi:hypothetical protein
VKLRRGIDSLSTDTILGICNLLIIAPVYGFGSYRLGVYTPKVNILPAIPASHSRHRILRRAKSAAISANKPRLVNLFSRQTLPLGGSSYQLAVYLGERTANALGLSCKDASDKSHMTWPP